MKNKLKILVGAVALVAVGLVAVHPGAASGGAPVRTGMAPVQAGIGVASFDDLFRFRFRNVPKLRLPRWRPVPVPVLRTALDDVLRQQSWRPTVQRVQAATSRLRSDQRVKVVAQACEVMDYLDYLDDLLAGEWTPLDQAKALFETRREAAYQTVSQISDGVEALKKVLDAFAEGRSDRYLILGEQVVCQAAGSGS
jgi:hypothetical protein